MQIQKRQGKIVDFEISKTILISHVRDRQGRDNQNMDPYRAAYDELSVAITKDFSPGRVSVRIGAVLSLK